ncbi:MAG: pilin [Patescibacteria group bacterium]
MRTKILLFSLLAIISTAFFVFPAAVLAQTDTPTDPSYGLNETAGKVDAFKGQTGTNYTNFLQTKAGQIIGVVLSFVGAIFLILMIYAGILWMTSAGNDQQITKAKGLMINAIIGMVIVFAAYAITTFLGGQLL